LGAGDRPVDGFVDEQGVERRVWIERLLLERENPAGGLVGRVAVSMPHYTSVATLVSKSDMVATLPRRLAEREAVREGLVILKPPYDPAPVKIEAIWAQRAERDVAFRWFVDEVRTAMGSLPPLAPARNERGD
jgi:DNA-binding transcriptional LysR family regulator